MLRNQHSFDQFIALSNEMLHNLNLFSIF